MTADKLPRSSLHNASVSAAVRGWGQVMSVRSSRCLDTTLDHTAIQSSFTACDTHAQLAAPNARIRNELYFQCSKTSVQLGCYAHHPERHCNLCTVSNKDDNYNPADTRASRAAANGAAPAPTAAAVS